jgi:alpha-N-arabinofuranosidase
MGALRADHGYEEPWEIEHWGVGNEVWGSWQWGHTSDASEYATGSSERIGFEEYSEAMREVDDSISVLASGWDLAEAKHNNNPWNETLLDELDPEILDGLNIHRYQWGLADASAVDEWKSQNNADDWDYSEAMVMAATQLGDQLAEVGEMAESKGYQDFYLNLSEVGIFPTVAQGAPYPGPETMPGAAYVAGVLNACIRETDAVKWVSQTWVPTKTWAPVKTTDYPPDPNPLRPDGSVTGLYSAVFNDENEWHALDVSTSGASKDLPNTGPRINPQEDVSYVDAAAMRNAKGRELAVFLTNRNLRNKSEITVKVSDWHAAKAVEIVKLEPSTDERPLPHEFPSSWDEPTNHEVTHVIEEVDRDGTLTIELEPAGVARLFVDNDRGKADINGDNGVWHGLDGEEDIPIENNRSPGKGQGNGSKR